MSALNHPRVVLIKTSRLCAWLNLLRWVVYNFSNPFPPMAFLGSTQTPLSLLDSAWESLRAGLHLNQRSLSLEPDGVKISVSPDEMS